MFAEVRAGRGAASRLPQVRAARDAPPTTLAPTARVRIG
jgi:hypothetical protein